MAPTPTELRIFNARNALKKLRPAKIKKSDGTFTTAGEGFYYDILAKGFGALSMKELSELQMEVFAERLEKVVDEIKQANEKEIAEGAPQT